MYILLIIIMIMIIIPPGSSRPCSAFVGLGRDGDGRGVAVREGLPQPVSPPLSREDGS